VSRFPLQKVELQRGAPADESDLLELGPRAKRRAASAFLAPPTCHTIATARSHGERWGERFLCEIG
jgi:hypothetical protein